MISARGITVRFGAAAALRGVSMDLKPGERLGVVGESGSGKTMLGLALMGMLPEAARVEGSIRIDGTDMTGAPEPAWRALRARRVAMIFQEPMAALNPLRRVGDTVMEPLRLHMGLSRAEARERALTLFEETGIQEPRAKLRQYPHELSGGQRQRVLIALALACDPGCLIADEPTTALDAHVGLRITELLLRLSRDRGMALVFISHDLAAIARTVDRIAVMYGGEIVERGRVADLLRGPRHPYTQGLLAARAPIEPGQAAPTPAGHPRQRPAMEDLPRGCRFAGRCAVELPHCAGMRPEPRELTPEHVVACHRVGMDR